MKNKRQPEYYDLVYEVVSLIPKGRVTTYGHIADYLTLGSARMVGWALNQVPKFEDFPVPAHRVVNRRGELSGRHHFQPPQAMQERLELEGVQIEDDKVVNFEKHLWVPSDEM